MQLWIILVLAFAVLVGGFLLKGEIKAPAKSGCNSCPNANKTQNPW